MLHGSLQFLQYIEILLGTLYYDEGLDLPCKKKKRFCYYIRTHANKMLSILLYIVFQARFYSWFVEGRYALL